jgi:predicted RNA-binding protein with PIN domain
MTDETRYRFDGYNLLHASGRADAAQLVDELAGFVALRGARGVVVFDGTGPEAEIGPLSVRYAPDADTLLERLAAEHRDRRRVLLVSSDMTLRGTAGQEVGKIGSAAFLAELDPQGHREDDASRLRDRVDPETRAKLERLRRGL